MSLPGFFAEYSLTPTRGRYAGRAEYGSGNRAAAVSLQGGLPVFLNGVDEPYDPIGTWPTEPPPGWTPLPPPEVPPPAGLGLGGTILVAAAAIAAGTLIGAGVGLGVQYATTPTVPPPPAPNPGCSTVGPNTQHLVHGDYWGCDRSLAKTTIDAQNYCAALTGRCKGTRPDGTPCAPYAVISDIAQIPGWTSCETDVYFVCECA